PDENTSTINHQPSINLGLRLAGALYWFWQMRGYYREGLRWLHAALEQAAPLGRTRERAKALEGAGQLTYYLEEPAKAIDLLAESTAIYRELGDQRGIAYSLIYQGICWGLQQDRPGAQALLTESVFLWRQWGDRWGLAMALWGLGLFAEDIEA